MYRAGIDLGGTNIKAGIVDEQQHIIAEASMPTNVERPYQVIRSNTYAPERMRSIIPCRLAWD